MRLALLLTMLASSPGEFTEDDLRHLLIPLGSSAVGALGAAYASLVVPGKIELGDRRYLVALAGGMAAGRIAIDFIYPREERSHGQATVIAGALLGLGLSYCSVAFVEPAQARAVMSPLTVLLPLLTTALADLLVYGSL